jgi:hypothetical protein
MTKAITNFTDGIKRFLAQVRRGIAKPPALVLLVLGGLIAFAASLPLEDKVFPSASIDLRMSKAELMHLAQNWSEKLGYATAGGVNTIQFNYDETAKIFLEHQLGCKTANQLMAEKLPVWYWDATFRHQLEKESMSVQISPQGRLLGFDYDIPDDKKLPSLEKQQAICLATDFLSKTLGLDLKGYKLVDDGMVSKPHRKDFSFTWEDSKTDYRDARIRLTVEVSGNNITYFDNYLHVPESWSRSYSTMRSSNELLYQMARVPFFILAIAAVFLLIRNAALRNIHWPSALAIAGLLSVAKFLECLNELEIALSIYSSDQSLAGFLTHRIVIDALGAAANFIGILILAGAAQTIYRSMYPSHLQISSWFCLQSLRSRQFIQALIAGHAAFGLSLAYQIIYYLLGNRLNFWCPLGVDNYQTIGTAIPAFSGVDLGLGAAVMEELLYRVIGLGLLQKLTRNFLLANLLQAAAWGFMHSNYPQQPAYVRGIELTFDGMFMGWLLKRYGLIACLVSHYALDAFWTAYPLFRAPVLALQASALLSVAPFLVVLAAALFMSSRRGFLSSSEQAAESNARRAESKSTELLSAVHQQGHFNYVRLSRQTKLTLTVIIAAALAISALHHDNSIGSGSKPLSISREQAIATARQYLQSQGIHLDGYLISAALQTTPGNNDSELEYLKETLGYARTKTLLESIEHPCKWNVRLCKPLDSSEYRIALDESGNLLSPVISLQDSTPGAQLTTDAARNLSEQFLRKYRPLYFPCKLDSTEQIVRTHRRDYKFTYSVPKYKVGDADLKVNIEIVGNQPANVSHHWQVPDSWLWEKNKQSSIEEALQVLRSVLVAVLSMSALIGFAWLLVKVKASWRAALCMALAAGLLTLAAALNKLPSYLSAYDTTSPWSSFVTMTVLQQVVGLIVGVTAFTLLFRSSLAAFKIIFPTVSLKSALSQALLPQDKPVAEQQKHLWSDALLAAAALLAVGNSFKVVTEPIRHSVSRIPEHLTALSRLAGLSNLSLPVDHITSYLLEFLLVPAALLLLVAFITRFGGKYNKIWRMVTLISIATVCTDVRHFQETLLNLASMGSIIALCWFFCARFFSKNPFSILVLVWLFAWSEVNAIATHALPLLRTDCCIIGAILLLPAAYLMALHMTVSRNIGTVFGTKLAPANTSPATVEVLSDTATL